MPSTHTSLHYHLVFSTKEREPWFPKDFLPKLHAYLGGIIRNMEGHPHAVGGVADHVHILAGLRPSHRLSDVMRDLKSDSSRWIKDELKRSAFAWQDGYGGFTVNAPGLNGVKNYVLHQEEHHRKQTFKEEYIEFLKRGLVEYDERYLW